MALGGRDELLGLGERGIIDVLAWHAGRRCLLVIELKTELVDPAALLAQVDRYRRLALALARERGWGVAGAAAAGGGVAAARAAGAGVARSRPAAGSTRRSAEPGAGSPARSARTPLAAGWTRRSAEPGADSLGRAAGPGIVACWVVAADTSSNRARLARHRTMLRGTFPVDGRQMAGWLADPREPVIGLSFLQNLLGGTATRLGPVRRVRGRGASGGGRA
jgi:hypothetical protein